MAVQRQRKGASHRGAPFAFWLVFFLQFSLSMAVVAAECPLDQSNETVTVSYIYDGDTVKLTDGRKVRFIGINTPEIDHKGNQSEPYAVAARQHLQQLLGEGMKLKLRYGSERHDHYGRTLAHPYLLDGRSLDVLLLRQGLATTLVVPPNIWNLECYNNIEQEARQRGMGVWSLPQYQVTPLSSLANGTEGYRIVRAKVVHVGESRKSLWIDLDGPAALRIPRKDLHYFSEKQLEALVGKSVVARGWLHYQKGRWRMTIRHPGSLKSE